MDQNLEHLLLLRMANLSMQHGNTDASTVAYAYLGLVVGVRFGQYAAAYRFGLLAIDLVDKKASIEPRCACRRASGHGWCRGCGTCGRLGRCSADRGIVETGDPYRSTSCDLQRSGDAWSRQRRAARRTCT